MTFRPRTSRRPRPLLDEDRRIALVRLEAAQRRDPRAVGSADRPAHARRRRWTSVLGGARRRR